MSNAFPFPHLPSKHTPIPSPLPLLTNPPTPTSWLWHSPTLGHQAFTGPRASPTDVLQGHRLLYMHLEPCVLFGWCFSPWELWGYWLVHIVVPPVGLQTPLAPWILTLVPLLVTLCSVQWLAESIHLFICQVLWPLSASTCWHPKIVSGFGDCIWDGSPWGAVSGWPFHQSLLYTLSL